MSMFDTPALLALERFLDLTAFRQGLVASNVANIDTPNHRTRDLDFRAELHRAAFQLGAEPPRPIIRRVSGLLERPDGNNVSLDREGLLLAENVLQYRIAVQLLQGQLRQLRTVINEGR